MPANGYLNIFMRFCHNVSVVGHYVGSVLMLGLDSYCLRHDPWFRGPCFVSVVTLFQCERCKGLSLASFSIFSLALAGPVI